MIKGKGRPQFGGDGKPQHPKRKNTPEKKGDFTKGRQEKERNLY